MIYFIPITFFVVLVTVLIRLNRKNKTVREKYILDDNTSNLSDNEKAFWLLLSLYRDKAINVDRYACEVASSHSVYMNDESHVSHKNFPERQRQLLNKGAMKVSEIVTAGSSVDILMDKFKGSTNHNKKMLDLDYNTCGISIRNSYKVLFITVIFIKI